MPFAAPYTKLAYNDWHYDQLYLDRTRGYLWQLGANHPNLWKIRTSDGAILHAGTGPDVPLEYADDAWGINYLALSQETGHVYVNDESGDASGDFGRVRCLDGDALAVLHTSPLLSDNVAELQVIDPYVYVQFSQYISGGGHPSYQIRRQVSRLPLDLSTVHWTASFWEVESSSVILHSDAFSRDGAGNLWIGLRTTLTKITPAGAVTTVALAAAIGARAIVGQVYDASGDCLLLLCDGSEGGVVSAAAKFALGTETVTALDPQSDWAFGWFGNEVHSDWNNLTRAPNGRVWVRLASSTLAVNGSFVEYDIPSMSRVRTYSLMSDWGLDNDPDEGQPVSAAQHTSGYVWDDCACALWLNNAAHRVYPDAESAAAGSEGWFGVWKLTLPDAPAEDCSPAVDMDVTPTDTYALAGILGGPFVPAERTYTVANTGGAPLIWTAAPNVAWLTVNGGPSTGGTLAPGATATVLVQLPSAAYDLAEGLHTATIAFVNTVNDHGSTTRLVTLTIGPATGMPVACEPLPTFLAYGATGGPEFGVQVFATLGGWAARVAHWPQVRGRWEVSCLNRTGAEMATLIAFFRAVTQGRAGQFCFTDWLDHAFSNPIGTGDGTTTTFQLAKVYTSGSLSATRPLLRPVASSLGVRVNGVTTTDYTLDPLRGLIVFASAPAAGAVVSASGEFEVLARLESDQLQVQRVAPDLFSCANLGLIEVVGE